MEPLSDHDLELLLSLWVAPEAPQTLIQKFSQLRPRWWERLFNTLGKRGRRDKRRRKAKRYDTI